MSGYNSFYEDGYPFDLDLDEGPVDYSPEDMTYNEYIEWLVDSVEEEEDIDD